jgi:hypothetical protein
MYVCVTNVAVRRAIRSKPVRRRGARRGNGRIDGKAKGQAVADPAQPLQHLPTVYGGSLRGPAAPVRKESWTTNSGHLSRTR